MNGEKDSDPQERQQQNHLEKLLAVVPELLDHLHEARGAVFALGTAIASTALNVFSYIGGETMHPTNVTLWTSITMGLLSVVCLILRRPTFPHSAKTISCLALASLFTGCGSVSLLVGIMISEPANAVSLFFTLPVILIILEAIINKQKTKTLHILLTFCSIIGVVFVAQPSFLFGQNSENHMWGIVFGLLSAFSHAGTFITFGKLAESDLHPFILSVSTAIGIMMISFSLCCFFTSIAFPPNVNMILVTSAAGVSHFSAYNFAYLALGDERPYVVSIIMTFEVAFTFVAQLAILNITPNWYSAIGGFLISVACIGVALTKEEKDNNDIEHNDIEPEEEELIHQ